MNITPFQPPPPRGEGLRGFRDNDREQKDLWVGMSQTNAKTEVNRRHRRNTDTFCLGWFEGMGVSCGRAGLCLRIGGNLVHLALCSADSERLPSCEPPRRVRSIGHSAEEVVPRVVQVSGSPPFGAVGAQRIWIESTKVRSKGANALNIV